MAEITVTIEEINEFRNFLVQYLKDCGYDGSVEDGTAIHDAVIKPMALLMVLFKSEAQKARAYFSLDKAAEIKDQLGGEYDSAVDSILGNWFVSRRQGSDTEATIKLVFSKPLSYLQITNEQAIATIEGAEFVSAEDKIFVEGDFAVVFNNVENTNEYAVSITCKTKEPSRVPLTTESVATSNFSNIYLQKIEVAGSIKLGNDIEDSDAFIQRTKTAITTRELISDRAIKVRLLEEFADISTVFVARYGSAEQMRDIVEFDQISVHVGNKADIYLRTTPILKSVDHTVAAANLVTLTQSDGDIIDVIAIRDTSASSGRIRLKFSNTPTSPITIPVTDEFTINENIFTASEEVTFQISEFLTVPGEITKYIMLDVQNTGGSFIEVLEGDVVTCSASYENFSSAEAYADFEPLPVPFTLSGITEEDWGATGVFGTATVPSVADGGTVQVDFLSTSVVSEASAYVTDDEQRVACYDPICKCMFTVGVRMELAIRRVADPDLADDALETRIKQIASEYSNQIPWTRTFSVSEFVHYIHANIADVEQVLLPAIFTADLRDPADLAISSVDISGVYELPQGLSQQVSWNTIAFFTDPSWVKVKIYR